MKKMTFGIIITNRSFFPAHLVSEEREKLLKKLDNMGYESVILSGDDTPLGAVMSDSDAEKCAELFKKNSDKIDGIVVVLPNFGEEGPVASAIQLSSLNVPVLVQACDDSDDRLQLENRRDAFCGKISVCNNLYQRGIKFTNTTTHTCAIESEQFSRDIAFFAAVCRVVGGLSHARIGMIGARPNAFNTVRFSQKLLQNAGITVVETDMSEIIFAALKLADNDPAVAEKAAEIRGYGAIENGTADEKVLRQAKLCVTLENWVKKNRCDASAVQCWDSIENNYGCATCLAMSMMGEKGMPSACETDVMGAVTMYALSLASGEPSGYLDWNNNYTDDRDKCICLHCSNFPKSFLGEPPQIGSLDVLGTTLGKEKCFGACKGHVAGGKMTFAKVSTDDKNGRIMAYVGEGDFLDDAVNTPGGVAACQISGLQALMKFICKNGFEHHVAMNRSSVADVLEEAFENYFGWTVYHHNA
jgi:L-fucose isomerase-like protein